MVGERILFLEYLKLLKKHKRDADRSRSLWTATTPYLSLAYHHNCGEFCFHVSPLLSMSMYIRRSRMTVY